MPEMKYRLISGLSFWSGIRHEFRTYIRRFQSPHQESEQMDHHACADSCPLYQPAEYGPPAAILKQ
jgi:hypothetical protein